MHKDEGVRASWLAFFAAELRCAAARKHCGFIGMACGDVKTPIGIHRMSAVARAYFVTFG